MKKVTFFALLVLASMIFVAPALKAQEAPAAEDAQVQEAQAPEAQAPEAEVAEAEKTAKAIAVLDDDDQSGNFFSTFDVEALGAFFGVEFDTSNPVITTSHVDEGEEEDEPIPPLSKGSLY